MDAANADGDLGVFVGMQTHPSFACLTWFPKLNLSHEQIHFVCIGSCPVIAIDHETEDLMNPWAIHTTLALNQEIV